MNKDRRKRIEEVMLNLSESRVELESILEEEQEAFDNLPEGIQESERGEVMNEAIDNLQSATDCFDDIESSLNEAQN